MNEIFKCKTYLKSRQEWIKEKFKPILRLELNHNHVFEHRVQEAFRNCNIVLRRIEVLENKYPEGLPTNQLNEILVLYKNFRFDTIPKLYNMMEIMDK